MLGIILVTVVLLLVLGGFYVLAKRTSDLATRVRSYWRDKNTPPPLQAIMLMPEKSATQGLLTTLEQTRASHERIMELLVGNGDKQQAIELLDTVTWNSSDHFKHNQFLNKYAAAINDNVSRHLIATLDWKESVAELDHFVAGALKHTEYAPDLPDISKYPANASIQYGMSAFPPKSGTSPVFEDYIRALNKVGLGLCFMSTVSDHFVIFIYKLSDNDEMITAVMRTGAGPGHGFTG